MARYNQVDSDIKNNPYLVKWDTVGKYFYVSVLCDIRRNNKYKISEKRLKKLGVYDMALKNNFLK